MILDRLIHQHQNRGERLLDREIEVEFANNFILDSKVQGFIKKSKGHRRRGYLNTVLPHCLLFKNECLMEFENVVKDSDEVYEKLRKKTSSNFCYVLSCNSLIDGLKLPLKSALEKVVGKFNGGTVLIIDPNRLAYFEGEEIGDRFILCSEKETPLNREKGIDLTQK